MSETMDGWSDWILNDGGPCPVEWATGDDLCIRFRNEREWDNTNNSWDWGHAGRDYDIVAYRYRLSAAPAGWTPPGSAPAASEDGWRPIETAPRDGTRILLACPAEEGGITVGVWDAEFKYSDYSPSADAVIYEAAWTDHTVADWGMEEYSELHPTHWRPRPTPPGSAPASITAPAPDPRDAVIREIADERRRQVEQEGWTPEHDDQHNRGEISRAGAAYAWAATRDTVDRGDGAPTIWPWSREWWKPTTPRSDLIKAAALIVAEIERLDRAAHRAAQGGQ